jgi:hypothetical protein
MKDKKNTKDLTNSLSPETVAVVQDKLTASKDV